MKNYSIQKVDQNVYEGCGKYWVGMDNNGIIRAVRGMDRCPYIKMPNGKYREPNNAEFGEFRLAQRAELEALGLTVQSGMMSGLVFYPNWY